MAIRQFKVFRILIGKRVGNDYWIACLFGIINVFSM